MTYSNSRILNHELIAISTEKFDKLFRDIQKQKKNVSDDSIEEVFFLELQLVNTFFQSLMQDLETIAYNEPELLFLETGERIDERRNELIDIARIHLIDALNKYDTVDHARILKSASFTFVTT